MITNNNHTLKNSPSSDTKPGGKRSSVFNGKTQQNEDEFAQLKENAQPSTRAKEKCFHSSQNWNEVPSSTNAS
jgi:hypothetical protein